MEHTWLNKKSGAGGVAQCESICVSPSMCEALDSIPTLEDKKKEKERNLSHCHESFNRSAS